MNSKDEMKVFDIMGRILKIFAFLFLPLLLHPFAFWLARRVSLDQTASTETLALALVIVLYVLVACTILIVRQIRNTRKKVEELEGLIRGLTPKDDA